MSDTTAQSLVGAPRCLLFTGKGGAGKTTVSAATAVHAARSGHKTLALSTDGAHSLADAFGVALGPEPTEVEPGLMAMEVDPRARWERHWSPVQRQIVRVLDEWGVDPAAAEEMTVLPAAEEVLALLELRDQVVGGGWDVVVVDCAPTAETLRVLALPEALSGYLDRAMSPSRRVARALRAGAAGPDPVLTSLQQLSDELREVRSVLTAPKTGIRLVLTPDRVVLAEARRTLTALSLYGYPVEAAVVNRVVPDGADPWRSARAAGEREVLGEAAESFGAIPLAVLGYRSTEPVGIDALAEIADDLYDDADPLPQVAAHPAITVERSGEELVLVLDLPLATKGEIDLARRADDLVIRIGAAQRTLALPSAMRRCRVAGAALRDGALRIRFEPDPALWRPL